MKVAKRIPGGFWGKTTVRERVGWVSLTITAAVVSGLVQGAASGFTHVNTTNPLWTMPASTPIGTLISYCAIGIVVAPLFETWTMQGLLQTAIQRWQGPDVALVVTTLVFFALHWMIDFQIFSICLVLCYIRMRTDSLGTVLVSHATWNAVAAAIALSRL